MNFIVTPGQLRDYLSLNAAASSSYSEDTLTSNIYASQQFLERECHRFFAQHDGVTWATTTMLQAQVPIPGFRSFDSITWGGAALTISTPSAPADNPSVWGLLEPSPGNEHPLVIALQFRPWRVDPSGAPWYLADPLWWDKALDSPFYPANYGGGYAWTSMPNDLVIVGDGGYASGEEPWELRQAVLQLAAFLTQTPGGLFSTQVLTPSGGSMEYTELPPYVSRFIATNRMGKQAVSVG